MNEKLKNKFEIRLNGFDKVVRSDFLMLKERQLKETEFFLFMLIQCVIVDFDSRHTYTYGSFFFDARQIEFYSGWNVFKVKKIFKQLLQKRLLIEKDKKTKLYEVVGYSLKKSMIVRKDPENA